MIGKYYFDRMITGASIKNLNLYYQPLMDGMAKYGIDTPQRQAMFLANVAHESGAFSATKENMNYSAERLMQIFPTHFDTIEEANEYAHQPEKIANKVYSGRYGNGDEASGDGWKYRGRGLIGTTFKDNYAATGKGIGIDLVTHPEKLEDPVNAVESACWFWKMRGLNAIADVGNITWCTRRINGGAIGLADRKARYEHIKKIFSEIK